MKKKILTVVLSVLAVVILAWLIWSNVTVGVTPYKIVSDRIPASFDGFKIVQVSDLHDASFGRDNAELMAAITNEKPDMIAITGDFVDSARTNVDAAVKTARLLAEIAPCYYVTGNHEARLTKEYRELEKGLCEAGVTVLHDEAVLFEKNGETIQIIGLFDPNYSMIQPKEIALKTVLDSLELSDGFRLLLSHRPETFEVYVAADMDLVLSGHAHGGQFRLPFVGGLFTPAEGFFPKYDAGLFTENGTTMIVSRGLGNSAFPIRFNNRPEIVSVTLIGKED